MIVGAWANHFASKNPFCAEAEEATQALQIASDMGLVQASFKGDAHNVIIALQGLD